VEFLAAVLDVSVIVAPAGGDSASVLDWGRARLLPCRDVVVWDASPLLVSTKGDSNRVRAGKEHHALMKITRRWSRLMGNGVLVTFLMTAQRHGVR
jgi:hypothetical protein